MERKHIEDALARLATMPRNLARNISELRQIRRDIVSLRATDYSAIHVTGGQPTDLSTAIVSLEAAEQRLASQVRRYVAIREAARELFHALEPTYSRILIELYIHDKSAAKAADAVHMSQASLYRYRDGAVDYIAATETLGFALLDLVRKI